MFAMIPAEFACDTRLNRADLRVFVGLASFADRDSRTCWPSRKALSLACGISSLPLISAALQRLERYGWIEIQHRYGSSVYRLLDGLGAPAGPVHPVVDTPVHPGLVDMNRPSEHINTPPLPPAPAATIEEREIEIIEAPAMPSASAEPAPASRESLEEPEKSCESLSEPEPACDGLTASAGEREAERACESAAQASDDEALALVAALVAASGAQYSTKPTGGPYKAAQRALDAGYSLEQIKAVIAWAASTWSSTRFLTPSAIFNVGKLDERLAQAKAQAPAGTRAGCHKPFRREEPIPRADPAVARSHIAKLKQALAA